MYNVHITVHSASILFLFYILFSIGPQENSETSNVRMTSKGCVDANKDYCKKPKLMFPPWKWLLCPPLPPDNKATAPIQVCVLKVVGNATIGGSRC
jgi:hypothetical protein